MQKQSHPRKSQQKGVVLIEAMIAIVIFAFGILGIVGLQAAMVKNTTATKYRSEASFIAQQYIGILWSNPTDVGNSLVVSDYNDISSQLPSGNVSVNLVPIIIGPTPSTLATVTVTWTTPGDPQQHKFTTSAIIAGG